MTGAKSFSVSYGRLLWTNLFTTKPGEYTIRVWPSGADFATTSVPTMPLAPGLVFDHEGLAELRLQLRRDHARHDIRPAGSRAAR